MSGEDARAPALRASDGDREETATLLREHCAAGRLTHEELAERLDGAYGARTVGELRALLHDLPPLDDLRPLDLPRATKPVAPSRERAKRRVLHAVGVAVLVNVAFLLLFFASGADGSFWPKWIIALTLIRLGFVSWRELGPAAGDEPRDGRGGSERLYRAERGELLREREEGARDPTDRR